MDEILIWPVLRGLPKTGHFTCVISAAYEREMSKTERKKRVRVVNEKPIIIWTPEASVGSVVGVSTISITQCGDENDPTAQLYAFPHSFQVSMNEHKRAEGVVESSALVRWDDAREESVDPGPRHLQFVLSQHAMTLPHSWNQTQNVTNYHTVDVGTGDHAAGRKWGFGFVRFFLLCLLLAVGKVLLWKLVRTLKPAVESFRVHFESYC